MLITVGGRDIIVVMSYALARDQHLAQGMKWIKQGRFEKVRFRGVELDGARALQLCLRRGGGSCHGCRLRDTLLTDRRTKNNSRRDMIDAVRFLGGIVGRSVAVGR